MRHGRRSHDGLARRSDTRKRGPGLGEQHRGCPGIYRDTPFALCTVPAQREGCRNVLLLALSLHGTSHTRSPLTQPPSLISPSCSSNCRIPNLALALPYQEVKTSPTQTMETPRWWCPTCCPTDPPWDGSCESPMSLLRFQAFSDGLQQLVVVCTNASGSKSLACVERLRQLQDSKQLSLSLNLVCSSAPKTRL